MKYKLTITPAIPPTDRHELEDALIGCGYDVSEGGTNADMSECDISFDGPDDKTVSKERGYEEWVAARKKDDKLHEGQ